MELIIGLPWECYVLSLLLVVAWPLLWWRGSRRIRLWYAGLTPLGAYAGFILGAVVGSWGRNGGAVPCTGGGGACDTAWEPGAGDSAAISDLGMVFMINSVLAFLVAVALGLLTLVVELVLLGVRARSRTTLRRSEEAPPGADS